MSLKRFKGQEFPEQHRRPELAKNATRCGICQGSADKMADGNYLCQQKPSHVADGFVGIWSDLTPPLLAHTTHKEARRSKQPGYRLAEGD